jgi:hypothetical protein
MVKENQQGTRDYNTVFGKTRFGFFTFYYMIVPLVPTYGDYEVLYPMGYEYLGRY